MYSIPYKYIITVSIPLWPTSSSPAAQVQGLPGDTPEPQEPQEPQEPAENLEEEAGFCRSRIGIGSRKHP
jgi:hypothetical protein